MERKLKEGPMSSRSGWGKLEVEEGSDETHIECFTFVLKRVHASQWDIVWQVSYMFYGRGSRVTLQDLSRLFFHMLAKAYRPNPTNINMSNDIPNATNAPSHSPVPEGPSKPWVVYAMNPTANAMMLHTSKTGGKLRTIACPCNPKMPC